MPRDLRRDWTEQWLGELWALERGPVSRSERLSFIIGAPRHAILEAFDDWTTHGILRDATAAARRLGREPLFSLVCIVVIAVAVAANASIFSALNATLLRTPPGIADGERIAQIGRGKADGSFDTLSVPVFEDIRAAGLSAFAGLAAYSADHVVLDDGSGPRLAAAQLVTADFFTTLRAFPSPGRALTRDEERGDPVAVIAHALWTRRFNGDPAAVGRTVAVGGVSVGIVGVAPRGFVGADIGTAAPELWLPLGFGGDARARLDDRRHSWIWTFGRLRDGIGLEQARDQLAPVHRAIEAAHPRTMGSGLSVVRGAGLRPDDRREARRVLALMVASVAAVLAIACANVASLLLARAVGRRRELAVRLAIGASRFRILRESLLESLLLALCAGAASVAVSQWTAALVRWLMPYELAVGFEPDRLVFAYTLACATLTGLLFGILPARRAARTELTAIMREGATSRGSTRARAALQVLQIALSFALIAGAAVLIRSVINARAVDPGFDPDDVQTATVTLARAGWDAERTAAFAEQARSALSHLPGVDSAAVTRRVPVADPFSRRSVSASDDLLDPDEPLTAFWHVVDPDYFTTLRTPIARGRAFDAGDRRGAEKVAVVSESLARRQWGAADPIGQTLRAGFDRLRVVGVARDAAVRSLRERGAMVVYAPIAQQPSGDITLLVRAAAGVDSAALSRPIRAVIEQLAPGVPITRAGPLRALVVASMGETRLTAVLLAVYGGIALLLSVVGLYALQVQVARQRRREFGVCLALGASPGRLCRGVVTGALGLTSVGLAVGLGAALLAAPMLERLLFDVRTRDPLSLLATAALFLVCSAAAAAGPARQAAQTDPVTSLRHD